MNKIIILEGVFYPKPEANAICSLKIAKELQKKGNEVHVICYQNHCPKYELMDKIYVHRIKSRMYFRMRFWSENHKKNLLGKLMIKFTGFFNKIKVLLRYTKFPYMSPKLVKKYIKKFEELNRQNNFDTIISVFNPFEAVYAGAKIKEKYPEKKHIMYVLDTLTNTGGKRGFSKERLDKQGWRWEQFLYERSDLIINMRCHEKHHSQARYDKYREKMVFSDIPLVSLDETADNQNIEKSEKIKIFYTGALDKMRDPTFACLLLSQIENIEVHFYCRGKYDRFIENFKKNIIFHGFIDKNKLQDVIKNADLFLSIGNHNSEMIPSKVFEYINSCLPIIHFYKNDNDSALKYLEKYGNALLISEKCNCKDNINEISNFLNVCKKADKISVINNFIENTPQYTIDLMEKVINV